MLLPTGEERWTLVLSALWAAANATVASIILLRRPGHAIGWLLAVGGLSFATQLLTAQYAASSLLRPGSLPGGAVAAWVSSWAGIPGFFSLLYLALLLPHGRLPSRRWRWVARLGGMAMAAA